ncbi:nucleotidyltransferase domain-containing protein [Candidatus Pacearchaeota archaeon]|nr:nucleotidyltransferase domain-containing protein [Candidatus Pacearchaeota archaeon]
MDRNQSEVIKLIKNFKNKIKNIKLDKVILFGSYSKGTQKRGSDIDLLVISNDFENIKSFKRANDLYLNWDIDIDIDFICLTNEELRIKKNQIGIVSEALKTGVVIK